MVLNGWETRHVTLARAPLLVYFETQGHQIENVVCVAQQKIKKTNVVFCH